MRGSRVRGEGAVVNGLGMPEVRNSPSPRENSNLLNSHCKIIGLIFFPGCVWDKDINRFSLLHTCTCKIFLLSTVDRSLRMKQQFRLSSLLSNLLKTKTFNTKNEYCYLKSYQSPKHINAQYKSAVLKSCKFVNFLTPFSFTVVSHFFELNFLQILKSFSISGASCWSVNQRKC